LAKVGVSFVSVAGAAANLRTEDPGWNLPKISGEATAQWNGLLGRVAVSGGAVTSRRIFYTALYHSLLFPSVFSDDDGRYIGFDHKVRTLTKGKVVGWPGGIAPPGSCPWPVFSPSFWP
jgi:putative alpha-1,2-mannosidase